MSTFPQKITSDDILICWKRPKWEVDLCISGWSEQQLREDYLRRKRDPERALEAAERQNSSRAILEQHFSPDQFISRNDLNRPALTKHKLLIVGGGDNHAIWAMRYVPRLTMAMALINSDIADDPMEGSHGGILNFSAQSFVDKLQKLKSGDFKVDAWSMIEVEINGKTLIVGSEASFGEEKKSEYSGNYIQVKDAKGNVIENGEGRHSGSGTLIATGPGTANGSWFEAEAKNMPQWKGPYVKNAYCMYVHSMGQNIGRRGPSEIDYMEVEGDCQIHITSMNDSNGIATADSHQDLAFPEQTTAVVRLAKTPLITIQN